ncbi:THO complex subunit 2 [Saccharomyces cerevisiae]|nr:THO complex subunit 2 [Saccharomyces cerevisiae]
MKQLLMLNSGSPLSNMQDISYMILEMIIRLFRRGVTSFFTDQSAISEIILLLYTLNLKANTQNSHYKILPPRCDERDTLLWSFRFEENVLPVVELNNRFHLSTPWTFHIWRDYLDNQLNSNDNFLLMNIEGAEFSDVLLTKISKDLFTTF